MTEHPEYTPRPSYEELPPAIRAWVDAELGTPVVGAAGQVGGFSPGCAARLTCRDGSRAFVKAASGLVNRDTQTMYRWEAERLAALPLAAPAPRLRAVYDEDPWIALLVDDIDGRLPELPWQADELLRVLDAMRTVGELPGPEQPRVADRVEFRSAFRQLASGSVPLDKERWPWVAAHVDRLAELESEAEGHLQGDRLLHCDVRADNVLLAIDKAWLVDWAWAARGPAWYDVVTFAPPVALAGGPGPSELMALAGFDGIDPDALRAAVAGLAGYFIERSTQPPPPGLPTVRSFQQAQAAVMVDWLRQLLGTH